MRGLGATVVASLHDLNLVHGFADDLLILADGHPLAFGPVEAVLTPELIARAFRVVATPRESAGFDFALPTEAHFQATMPTIPEREKSS